MENAGRALEALRAVGDRNRQAKTHVMIAKAQRELGKLEEAKRSLEAAIELTEEVRGNAGDDESRAGYIASSGNAHEPYIDLLMELHRLRPLDGFSVAAFEAGERARARSLLDLVAESGINIREGVDEGLLARERNIEEQMQGKAARLMPLLAAQRASATVDALSADLRRLRAEQQQVRAAIREVSPQYASITESRPLMTRDVQALLEPQTALLAYSLGASRSFLWVVTREAVHAYQLPGRSEIEQSVSRLCELVTARATFPRLETAERRKLRIAAADRELDEVSRAAARMLIAPAAKELRGKHLVLAADGILQQLPFALLPDENGEPLIAGHKLSSVPSASVLAGIRQAIAQRPVPTGSIAIFADPVFGASDPRVRGATGQATRGVSGDRDTLRILEHVAAVPGVEPVPAETQLNIPRLPHTRREAQRILSLARGRKIEALGFRATRAAVLESDLAQFRYVHFATHGFADVERPGLSSILLSMVDERGRPQNGFLRADDIYNLKLSSDLVVLSACKTGLGKHVRGEGMFGLTRGFFYAGAARVLVSLWNVNDEATSELMDLLYTRMMARGQPAAVALREAQLELRKDKRWSSPYYWAAFSLQGEWR
jgi:CHAT domain-containing protein